MGLTSLQVCMDSSDWLQGTIPDDNGMDSSSPSGDILTCSRPLIERRLRPPHDQALKCPRCDSTHTKFCYYNNYSLTQPRYFCKTCRRYWTKGGTLRNIPVGGGCRKNKKVSNSKKSSNNNNDHPSIMTQIPGSSSLSPPSDLRLAFPEAAAAAQFSHLTNLFGNNGGGFENFRYNYNGMVENPRAIDFMESKYEGLIGNSRNHDFIGNGEMGMNMIGGLGHDMSGNLGLGHNFNGLSSPFGLSLDGGNSNNSGHFMDYQRLMVPYEGNENHNGIDVKPNTKLLALEWQDQGCSSDAGKDSFGYINGLGSWSGLMNGYGPPATNP